MEVIEIKQKPTTIWIKQGTKQELDKLGERKDTYDDIIWKLITDNRRMKATIEGIQESTPRAMNKIEVTKLKRRKAIINMGDKVIHYTYNVPISPLPKSYRLGITVTKIYEKQETTPPSVYYKRSGTPHINRSVDYLWIVEHVMKNHFNPLFKISKKHLLDMDWWRRMFKKVGLRSYKEDIEEMLIKWGLVP